MEYIKAIVIGAGSRGQFAYGKYAIKNPDEIKFIAIAEPNKIRRESFVVEHGIKSQNIFNDWRDLLNRDKFADVVFICTPDKMHFDIAMIALEKGYDLLLEKPIAPTYQECQIIADKAKEMGASVAVAHVLRYTPFFSIIKEIIDSKKFGNIRGINYIESVGHIHYSHSFVRGNWRNEDISAPMILAKSCHDMDMLLYLIGSDCSNISSYGSKGFFSSKNKPAGTPHRCLDGCPIKDECPYYAPNIYIDGNPTWVAHLGLNSTDENDILESLKTSPYGICVYDCDNNMCEQQDVILKFKNNVTASFTMSAFTQEITRTVKIMMEKGELIGDLHSNKVDVYNFLTGKKSTIHNVSSNTRGHGGGDEGLMKEFLTHLKDKEKYPLKTSIEEAVQSHKMALLAHKAMVDNIAIELD